MVVLCAPASQILKRESFDMRPGRPITSGSRHARFDSRLLLRKYGCGKARLQMSSKPLEIPSLRFVTNKSASVMAAIAAPAKAQDIGVRP